MQFGINFNHLLLVSQDKTPVIEYEYQAICLDCEEYLGKSKRIWAIAHKSGVTNHLMRYALKECITRKKPFVNYFLTIINNKIK